MSRRYSLFIIALVASMLFVPPAQADTLMITFGAGAFDVGGETRVGLSGDGWFMSYTFLGGMSGDPRSQGGSLVDGGFGSFSGVVQAFGDVCTFGFFGGVYSSANCGFFRFTAPDYPPGPMPPGTVVTGIPVTATGHLNVGPGYDFFGEGTVDGFYRFPSPPDLRYHFAAVPDPSTLGLVVMGLGVMAWAWRRRRQVWRLGALLALLLGGGVASAQATTLTITAGDAILYRLGDSSLGFIGDGWSVSYYAQGGRAGDGSSQGVSFTLGLLGAVGVVQAFGDVCTFDYHNPVDAAADCGFVQFTAPTYPQGVFPLGTMILDIPMTVAGHLNVGPGYDFVGQGTVDGVYDGTSTAYLLRYHVAAVPDPSTLGLVATGLGLMACAWGRRQA